MSDNDRLLPERSGNIAMDRGIRLQNFEDVARCSKLVLASGTAPSSLDDAEKVAIAIMQGGEVGMGPMMSIKSIAVINGRPSIWGDGAMGLVLASGLLEHMDETIEGEGDERVAVCTIKRKGLNQSKYRFSVDDAKLAGLWEKRGKSGKPTPWITYPERMLKMRARGFALRDNFADVLGGLYIAEEAQDMAPRQMKDITDANPLGDVKEIEGDTLEYKEDSEISEE